MTNLEAVLAILASHREARNWTDEAVANDLLMQLDIAPGSNAAKATPVIPPGITEAEVVAHEAAAKEAVDKAKAARDALNAQTKAEHVAAVPAMAFVQHPADPVAAHPAQAPLLPGQRAPMPQPVMPPQPVPTHP